MDMLVVRRRIPLTGALQNPHTPSRAAEHRLASSALIATAALGRKCFFGTSGSDGY
jgi:hypothetical protein